MSPYEQKTFLFRNLLRGSAFYTGALLAYRLAAIVVLPINTRFLSPADYGVLELLEQSVTVIGILLGVNLSLSLGYFYFETESPSQRTAAATTAFWGAFFAGLAAAGLATAFVTPLNRLLFGGNDFRFYLLFAFLSLPLGLAVDAEFSWLRVADRPGAFMTGTLLRLSIQIAGALIFVAGMKLRIWGVLSSSMSGILGAMIFVTVYWVRKAGRFKFDARLFARMFHYSLPLVLGSAGMFWINFGDRFLLPRYRPMAELGVYSIACKIGIIISFVYSSFSTYWSAQIYDIARREDAESVISRIFTWLMVVLSFCSLGLVFLARPALRILTTPRFLAAAGLVPLIVGAFYLRSIGEFFRFRFMVEGKPKYEAVCTGAATVVCTAAYYSLIPRFGAWGAAMATVVAFAFLAILSLVWTYALKPYMIEPRLTKVALVAIGLLVVWYVAPVEALSLQIAWSLTLLLAYAALLWIWNFVRPGEIVIARTWIARLSAIAGESILRQGPARNPSPAEP